MINVTTFTSNITVKDSELEAVANSLNLNIGEEITDPELRLTHIRLALNEHLTFRMKELTMPYVNMLAGVADANTRAYLNVKVNEAVSTNIQTSTINEVPS
jgi:hypothetical protein